MSFKDLKSRLQNSTNSMDKIKSRIEQETQKNDYKDDRYWNFETDASGNGMAVIRFLPEPEGEEFPYVSYYEHAFKGDTTGKWYIKRSLTSLGRGVPDPVALENTRLWETGVEANQNIARKRKRHLKYVSNIYIVSDKKNPENEGKVMLWKYGPAIYKIIADAINPPEEFEEEPLNPFDLWNGADFKLKAYVDSGSGFRKYDKSSFANPAPLLDGDDDKLEKVYNQLHSLEAEVAEDKYESFDDLKKWFDIVVGNTTTKTIQNDVDEDDDLDSIEVPSNTVTTNNSNDDDDDYMNFLEDD